MKVVSKRAAICSLLTLAAQCTPFDSVENGSPEKRQISNSVTYHSTNLTNPTPTITKSGTGALAPGYLFFGTEISGAHGLIMDDDGQLIWAAPDALTGSNLRPQHLNGEPVLTNFNVMSLNPTKGFLYGSVRILDQSYAVIHEICPKLDVATPGSTSECNADAHEQVITKDGTLLVTAYNTIKYDLSPIGGPKNGWIAESRFYELAIPSGKILYKWASLEHVPLNATKLGLMGAGYDSSNPFDYLHINSVQKIGTNYLINGRHVWASYLINGNDGSVVWTFNGYDGGTFGPLPDAPTGQPNELFSYQHDARIHDVTEDTFTLELFNNNNYDKYGDNPSTGFAFQLNYVKNTSTLLHDWRDPSTPVYSGQEGGLQRLSNGNTLIGYGNPPIIQEFGTASDTKPLMTLTYGTGPNGGNYRAYKSVWVGRPGTPPAVAVDEKHGFGYVSWNGATEVTTWVVKSGTPGHLEHSVAVPKKGFETRFRLPSEKQVKGKFLQVVAKSGTSVLGRSKVVRFRQ